MPNVKRVGDLPPNNVATKIIKKRPGWLDLGNLLFMFFLAAWTLGLYKACDAHWKDGSLWPEPYPFENKLFEVAHNDFSLEFLKDLYYQEPIEVHTPTTLHDYRGWLNANVMIPTVGTVVYLAMLFLGPSVMTNFSRPFWHKPMLTLWSLALAAFSTLGAYRVVPTILKALVDEGWNVFICGPPGVNLTMGDGSKMDALNAAYTVQEIRQKEWSPYFFMWVYMFILSKVPELVDTFFIIVGKGSPRFLHWYHHVTVLWYTWNLALLEMSTSVFAGMNLCVHSIMYTWYALAAADGFLTTGLKAKKFAMMVTSIQILQMMVGNFVTVYQVLNAYNASDDKPCVTVPEVGNYGVVMYGSYLVLFVKLFIDAYVCPSKRPKKKTA